MLISGFSKGGGRNNTLALSLKRLLYINKHTANFTSNINASIFHMSCSTRLFGSTPAFYIYFSCLILYCLGIVIYARYGLSLDDPAYWLEIIRGNPITDGYRPNIGRFYPLAFADLNILMQFFSSPYVFFGINAVLVFVIGVLLWYVLACVLPRHLIWLSPVVLMALFFTPGFVTIMLGICYPERLQILFLCIFVLSSLHFFQTKYIASAIIGVISANLAMYYKEPTFVIIATFGAMNLIASYKLGQGRRTYLYYGVLLGSAMLFVLLYMILVYPYIVKAYHLVRADLLSDVLYFLKGFLSVSLDHCFLSVLLMGLVAYRLYRIVIKKDYTHIFWDSLLLGGILYLVAFVKLGIFSTYYFTPVYFVSTGGMLYFLCKLNYLRYALFKYLTFACVALFCLSSLPSGIFNFVKNKTDSIKFHQSLDFVTKKAKEKDSITLFFDGNGKGIGNIFNHYYWKFYMRYLQEVYGVSNAVVKVQRADVESTSLHSPISNTQYNDDEVATPQSGDMIILTNSTNKAVDSAYLAQMREQYDLIYQSDVFGIPYLSIKSLLKYGLRHTQAIQNAQVGDENYFKLPLRDYIYVVR